MLVPDDARRGQRTAQAQRLTLHRPYGKAACEPSRRPRARGEYDPLGADPGPVGELELVQAQLDDVRVRAKCSTERADKRLRRAARIDLGIGGDEPAADAIRRDARLEGAACVTVEPVAHDVRLVECEEERTAPRVAEIDACRIAQLVRELRPQSGRTSSQRAELLVGGQHTGRRVRRPTARLSALDHAYA